jgi:chromosomal replication initiation ATPase DnaA
MKLVSHIARREEEAMLQSEPVVCEYLMTPFGPKLLDEMIISTEHQCEYCLGKKHYTPLFNPAISMQKMWLCANTDCLTYSEKKVNQATTTPVMSRKALEWPLFCEINHLGDEHHSTKFELVNQTSQKLAYLLKFGSNPRGLILMQGDPGTGKSYAAIAVCELYTRTSPSCYYYSHRRMLECWTDSYSSNSVTKFSNSLKCCNLLVIDDFGLAEPSTKFMGFFMDLIDSRLQWTDKGTIITTNLDVEELSVICGQALIDRINTGQLFQFEGSTRRKQTLL